MKGDFTRDTFDPKKHYSSVRMQQGRVQVDADWNEQQDITDHRIETETVDVVGPCGGPIHDAGFALEPQGNDLNIGAGRYYVDGILCENDGDVLYSEQPDLPLDAPVIATMADPPVPIPPPEDGTYLGYLDVWSRHLTALEDPSIREVALGGPDTATRTKTTWQVRLHRIDDADLPANCLSDFAFWETLTGPNARTLAARAEPDADSDNPCTVAPGAGFRRLENQLYRVEIHDPTNPGPATFKWSRDNGSILTTWESKNANDLTVTSIGRDKVLSFANGDWVELTDDTHELLGVPGTLVRLDNAEGQVLTIDPATATGSVDLADFPDNPKVRRWDFRDLTVPLVEVPATNDGWITLEDGVEIQFDDAGTYQTGDYWLIPARTATADVEWPLDGAGDPAQLPPEGIEHHYCRLALLSFAGGGWTEIEDCRNLFPPLTELTSLFYVSGDGQETALAEPTLAHPLQVGVANGQWPVAGASVRFLVTSGGGQVNGSSQVEIETGTDGIAGCTWTLGEVGQLQIVEATLLDAAGEAIHLPIRFTARYAAAGEDPGLHVTNIRLADGNPLLNDAEVPVSLLVDGITIEFDGDIEEAVVINKPVCYVTLQMPFPFNIADRNLWGFEDVLGTQPLRLTDDVQAGGNEILWQPADATRTWLVDLLFSRMEELSRGERILAYLTLKGNFIWSETSTAENLYLDGEVFGELRDDGGTDIVLPSGDRRRGGDLEMWFWLVEQEAAPIGFANVQFIHNAPFLGDVGVFLNNVLAPQLAGLPFQSATPYGNVQAGPTRIDIVDAADADNSNPIFSTTDNFNANENYVVIIQSQRDFAGAPIVSLAVRDQARLTATSDVAEFFLVHGSPDIDGVVDVQLLDESGNVVGILADDIDFGFVGPYLSLSPTLQRLRVVRNDTGALLGLFPFDLSNLAAQAFTLLVSGLLREQTLTMIGFDADGNPILPTGLTVDRLPGGGVVITPINVRVVTGIGQRRESLLAAEGITSANEVAVMDVARLAAVLNISRNRATTLINNAREEIGGRG